MKKHLSVTKENPLPPNTKTVQDLVNLGSSSSRREGEGENRFNQQELTHPPSKDQSISTVTGEFQKV